MIVDIFNLKEGPKGRGFAQHHLLVKFVVGQELDLTAICLDGGYILKKQLFVM